MKMNNEKTITKTLRRMSEDSKSSQNFKAGLLDELQEIMTKKPKKKFIFNIFIMKNYLLPSVILGILAITFVGSVIYFSNNKKDDSPQKNTPQRIEAKNVDYDTAATTEGGQDINPAAGMRLATDFHKTISDAQKNTSFSIKRATIQLGNEILNTIETSMDFPESDPNMDSYYLSYNENNKLVYKISGMGVEREFIEGEEVSVNGVKAYYYKVPAEEISDGENIAVDEFGPSARSYVYWNQGGHSYEVQEFSGMSKNDLLKLAASVQ